MGNWWGGRWKVKVPHSTVPSNTLRCWNRNVRGLQIWPGNGGGRRKVGRRPPPYTHDRPMMITMVMPEHRTHHRNTGTPEHRNTGGCCASCCAGWSHPVSTAPLLARLASSSSSSFKRNPLAARTRPERSLSAIQARPPARARCARPGFWSSHLPQETRRL